MNCNLKQVNHLLLPSNKESFEQGNIFTSVCHSLLSTGGEQVYLQGDLHLGGLHLGNSASRGSASRGVCIQGVGQTLTPRALQGMVNNWAVSILLEYILEYPCSPPVDRRNDIRLWNTQKEMLTLFFGLLM